MNSYTVTRVIHTSIGQTVFVWRGVLPYTYIRMKCFSELCL